MIITLEKAKSLLGIAEADTSKDTEITEKLKSFEIMIRNMTNNKFLDTRIRSDGKKLVFDTQNKTITGDDFHSLGFRAGDSIDIDECLLNRGIYTVTAVSNTSITVSENLIAEDYYSLVTKIVYPYDIVMGVIKLIQYDFKMSDKIGIKSETISRMSTTYYDVNSTESIEGYPAALMGFLSKYKKLRWS